MVPRLPNQGILSMLLASRQPREAEGKASLTQIKRRQALLLYLKSAFERGISGMMKSSKEIP